jgi:hypothetical protein
LEHAPFKPKVVMEATVEMALTPVMVATTVVEVVEAPVTAAMAV